MALGSCSPQLYPSEAEGFYAEKEIDLLLQITENVWVQCEDPNCQKWRKVPKDCSAGWGPDTPWFCSMNPDSNADNCSKPEENHSRYDEIARKAGIKFVMSELEMGELVWAKTAGYCRWPAVITTDPDSGFHVSLDLDGDALAYHVEYLGNPHTHCWVHVAHVEKYGHKYKHVRDLVKENRKSCIKGKKKGKRKSLTRSYKGSGRQFNIEEAVDEAEGLLPMSKTMRLQLIVFEYEPQDTYLQVVPSIDINEQFPPTRALKDKKSSLTKTPNGPGVMSQRKSSKVCNDKDQSVSIQKTSKTSVFNSKHPDRKQAQHQKHGQVQELDPQRQYREPKKRNHCKDNTAIQMQRQRTQPNNESQRLIDGIKMANASSDLFDSPADLDAMMKELEEDIEALSPCSEDNDWHNNADEEEMGSSEDIEYFFYSSPPKLEGDSNTASSRQDVDILLDDIEVDLSTMEDYFDNV